MGNELKKTIVAADHRAQYDECVKKLLSHKEDAGWDITDYCKCGSTEEKSK